MAGDSETLEIRCSSYYYNLSKGVIVVMAKRKNYSFKFHHFFCTHMKDIEDGPDGIYINRNKYNFDKIDFFYN